jgi:hypothetical protein
MIVGVPEIITDAMITSDAPSYTSANFPGMVDWTATDFSEDQYVLYDGDNSVYRANAAVIATDVPGDSEKWTFIAKNNPYRLIDGVLGSATQADGGFTMSIDGFTKVLSSVACFNVRGVEKVILRVTEDGDDIFEDEVEMQDNSMVMDEWDYFFLLPREFRSFAFHDLPATVTGVYHLEFQSSSTAVVGELIMTNIQTVGTAIMGCGFDNADLSRVQYDEDFGAIKGIIRRPNRNIFSYDVRIDSLSGHSVENSRNILEDIGKSTLCFWAATTDIHDKLLAYGFYDRFSVVIPSVPVSDCSITVNGVI